MKEKVVKEFRGGILISSFRYFGDGVSWKKCTFPYLDHWSPLPCHRGSFPQSIPIIASKFAYPPLPILYIFM